MLSNVKQKKFTHLFSLTSFPTVKGVIKWIWAWQDGKEIPISILSTYFVPKVQIVRKVERKKSYWGENLMKRWNEHRKLTKTHFESKLIWLGFCRQLKIRQCRQSILKEIIFRRKSYTIICLFVIFFTFICLFNDKNCLLLLVAGKTSCYLLWKHFDYRKEPFF